MSNKIPKPNKPRKMSTAPKDGSVIIFISNRDARYPGKYDKDKRQFVMLSNVPIPPGERIVGWVCP